MKDVLEKVGKYKPEFNTILHTNLPAIPIYKSSGLKKHIEKRHPDCIEYFVKIEDILTNPDYIGTKGNGSVELVKIYDKNLLLALQLDISNKYFYVASLYDISTSKLNNRIHSGRLKSINLSAF